MQIKSYKSRFVHYFKMLGKISFVVLLIVAFRFFVCEIYLVDSPSMIPTILPVEVYCVDKLACGALMPQRFADIPILNVFTWVRPLREIDERNSWRMERVPGFRKFKKGDVVLFHAKDDGNKVLVKRIDNVVNDNGQLYYYMLGDNAGNSTDSRHFGLIHDSLVIGKASYILFSWDSRENGLNRIRWNRLGKNISHLEHPTN